MLEKVLDLFWPRRCAVCGGKADRPGRHLCSDCLMRIPFVPTDGLCRRCGRDAPGLDGEFLCSDCADELRPAFDRAASAMRFEGEARELVNAFKFRGALHLRGDFVDFLEATARARFRVGEIGFVAPMPSAAMNRFYRGYNQCDYIAKGLSRATGIPVIKNAVKRLKSNETQTHKSRDERWQNVEGIFALSDATLLEGKHILLIDVPAFALDPAAKVFPLATLHDEVIIAVLRIALQVVGTGDVRVV